MSDEKNNLYDKCVVCGSPYRHEKEIHTFICINKKCGYREWYPVRRYDIPNIIENARTQQKAEIVKLIDEMLINRPKPAVMSDNHYKEHILHTTECPLCRFDREILMNLKSKVKEMK